MIKKLYKINVLCCDKIIVYSCEIFYDWVIINLKYDCILMYFCI